MFDDFCIIGHKVKYTGKILSYQFIHLYSNQIHFILPLTGHLLEVRIVFDLRDYEQRTSWRLQTPDTHSSMYHSVPTHH